MRMSGLIGLAASLTLAGASPALSQTWPICFEGEATPTPSTYAAFRGAAALFQSAGPFRARAILRSRSDSRDGERLPRARLSEAYLEVLRAGISPGYLTSETAPELEVAPECLELEIRVTPSDQIPLPPMLWHLRGAYFDSGSIEIGEGGVYWIRIAAALNRPGQVRYILDGHTDALGSIEANLELSRRRVEAVAERLAREGVRWEDIEMSWHGETRLARATEDEVAEPLNRRVWIDMRGRPATSD
ncbi:MAG: OmpA family protein [Brevundimonas sp.]|nr:MAG: OmpA family protein [Brevundimonas sp.]